jgi:hypothetical protein
MSKTRKKAKVSFVDFIVVLRHYATSEICRPALQSDEVVVVIGDGAHVSHDRKDGGR